MVPTAARLFHGLASAPLQRCGQNSLDAWSLMTLKHLDAWDEAKMEPNELKSEHSSGAERRWESITYAT